MLSSMAPIVALLLQAIDKFSDTKIADYWPNQDPINQLGLNVGVEDYIPDLEKRTLFGSGYFAQEDKPEQLSAYIVEWLNRKFKKSTG